MTETTAAEWEQRYAEAVDSVLADEFMTAAVTRAVMVVANEQRAVVLREAADDLRERMTSFSQGGRHTRAAWAVEMLALRAVSLATPERDREKSVDMAEITASPERLERYAEVAVAALDLNVLRAHDRLVADEVAGKFIAIADAEQAELREDVTASGMLIDRQSALLTGVANALRGRPPELTHWSHHDLPQRAADLAAYAQHEADSMADALARAEAAEGKVARVEAVIAEWEERAEEWRQAWLEAVDDESAEECKTKQGLMADPAIAIRAALAGPEATEGGA